MTLEPFAERLAMELSLPVFYDLGLSRLGFEHPTFRLRDELSYGLRHRRGHHRTMQPKYIVMMTKEGSTKLVNFVLATVGPMLWCGHIGEIVKMFNFNKNLQIYSLAWLLLSKEFDDDHRL